MIKNWNLKYVKRGIFMKITSKLIITIIIVSLLCLFSFEMIYNRIVYKNYSELYQEYMQLENRVDTTIDLNFKLIHHILDTDFQ